MVENSNDGDELETKTKRDTLMVFKSHRGPVLCGSLSKDVQFAVTGGADSKVYLHDLRTFGSVILTMTFFGKELYTYVDFSYDDRYIAIGDNNGTIQVYKKYINLNALIVHQHECNEKFVWIQWHHTILNRLLGLSLDGRIYSWDVPSRPKSIKPFNAETTTACLTSDGNKLIVGCRTGTLNVVDLITGVLLTTVTPDIGHTSDITSVDCHANNLIISGAMDGKTIISDANTGEVIIVLHDVYVGKQRNIMQFFGMREFCDPSVMRNWTESIAIQKNVVLPMAATGTFWGEIFIWDVESKLMQHKLTHGGVTRLMWKENTSILFSASMYGNIKSFNGTTGECLYTFKCEGLSHLHSFCLSSDGKKMLTTTDDGVAVFDIEDDLLTES
ncbi:uncharacterized protein LOC131670271 [Phymastichus coffea]|uniref:uncharacterized protein LOC131670271 n=1 Tax=Phymastichus coffea TaxID=108790 RepID=UPI00273A7FEF|nr:uncharacterized protein LOC131670271 [Phymastichus coffea]